MIKTISKDQFISVVNAVISGVLSNPASEEVVQFDYHIQETIRRTLNNTAEAFGSIGVQIVEDEDTGDE